MAQIHKKFTDDQIKNLLERYLKNEIERKYIQEILDIKKRRFFLLLKEYRNDPESFSIEYVRNGKTRSIDPGIETNIIKELTLDRNAIQNKDIPLKSYNYSYVKDRLKTKYKQKISLPTIIDRAKKMISFCQKRERKRSMIVRFSVIMPVNLYSMIHPITSGLLMQKRNGISLLP